MLAAVTAAFGLSVDTAAQRAHPDVTLRPRPLVAAPDAKTPVRLERAAVDVEAIGSIARTTLLLTLRNPNDRQLEGSLEFPLQAGQQVTGFALDIDGTMRDAVPVPKERGRQVFESIERRNVDPALLEQVAGNHFRLRIYPIPARGTRQVRLVIDEAMRRDGDAWRLQLPLQLLAEAPGFALHVRGRKPPELLGAFAKAALKREGDGFAVDIPRAGIDARHGLALRFAVTTSTQVYAGVQADAHYVLAEVPVASTSKPRAIPHDVMLLWDASASGHKRDHAGELELLDRYFKAMGEGRVHLRLLRDVGVNAGAFQVRAGAWAELRKALASVVYDGATDLADWTPERSASEVLLVSDGMQNYGGTALPGMLPGQRLYALASTSDADATRLSALAESRGGRLVAWQGRDGLAAATRALLEDGAHVLALDGAGVEDVVAQSRWIDDGLLRVAGRLREPTGRLSITLEDAAGRHTVDVPVSSTDEAREQVSQAWAAWRMQALSAEPERNQAAIARLGNAFGLVTAGSSLLVLDDPADYVRYDIPAPPALQTQLTAIRIEQLRTREASRSERLDNVAQAFAERAAWWEHEFPKGKPTVEDAKQKVAVAAAVAERERDESRAMAPPPAPAEPPVVLDIPRAVDTPSSASASAAAGNASTLDSVTVVGSAAGPESAGGAVIRLQPWEPDSPYARRLRDASADQLYTLYLDERDSHADSTAFYLDVADLLLQRGQRGLALRVLSNLAELQLENRHVLRVLGYRLMQAKEYARAVQVFRQVLAMADEEPQSHRDLGLALAASDERQEAIRHLYNVVAGQWDGRFAEIELVALNEMNQVIATSPKPLDTGFIDARLLKNMPLDLRVALSWDSDNSDMDLWVTDPNGEKCYYSHTLTYQGGLISDDFTGGYGPEEFVLHHAKPGKYKVQAHFFGDRQQIVTGATTLTLRLSTGWATPKQQDQTVTLRLSGKDESVLVGEFEVK
ncbi:DUF2135 domain-containing protein [Thermomonas sp. HDW16]|nr:DUF2135 domain-containing protein [Thermomonas sp. HDW16]